MYTRVVDVQWTYQVQTLQVSAFFGLLMLWLIDVLLCFLGDWFRFLHCLILNRTIFLNVILKTTPFIWLGFLEYCRCNSDSLYFHNIFWHVESLHHLMHFSVTLVGTSFGNLHRWRDPFHNRNQVRKGPSTKTVPHFNLHASNMVALALTYRLGLVHVRHCDSVQWKSVPFYTHAVTQWT